MSHVHAIVWLDHRRATVVGFSGDRTESTVIESERPQRQIHRKSGTPGSGHAPDDVDFFDDVVTTLDDTREVLVTGPGTAKLAFTRHLEERHPDLAQRVVGTESLDHPTTGELLAFGRKYFKGVDQLGNF